MEKILIFSFLIYSIMAYGLANIIVYSNGPFYVFSQWREFAMNLNEKFGELFTCMICISTWIGLFFSVIDLYLLEDVVFTPFNIMFYNKGYDILTLLCDMGVTSGIVWLIHQFEEMLERVGYYGEE